MICFLCESLFLSSSVGIRSTCLFTFEFISRYCTLIHICPPGRERGWLMQGCPQKEPPRWAERGAGWGMLFCSSPPTFVQLSRGPLTLRASRRNLCARKTEPPPGRSEPGCQDVKDASVYIYVCVRERKRGDRRLSFVSLL